MPPTLGFPNVSRLKVDLAAETYKCVSLRTPKWMNNINRMGMWLSGRAFALHVKGPGFDPRHLHWYYFVNFRQKKLIAFT